MNILAATTSRRRAPTVKCLCLAQQREARERPLRAVAPVPLLFHSINCQECEVRLGNGALRMASNHTHLLSEFMRWRLLDALISVGQTKHGDNELH